MLPFYVPEHQEVWDELLAVHTLAYNSRFHRITGVAPLDFVTPRQFTTFSLDRIPDGLQPALKPGPKAKDEFLKQLKLLLPRVKESTVKTQERYRRDFDKGVRKKNKEMGDGD